MSRYAALKSFDERLNEALCTWTGASASRGRECGAQRSQRTLRVHYRRGEEGRSGGWSWRVVQPSACERERVYKLNPGGEGAEPHALTPELFDSDAYFESFCKAFTDACDESLRHYGLRKQCPLPGAAARPATPAPPVWARVLRGLFRSLLLSCALLLVPLLCWHWRELWRSAEQTLAQTPFETLVACSSVAVTLFLAVMGWPAQQDAEPRPSAAEELAAAAARMNAQLGGRASVAVTRADADSLRFGAQYTLTLTIHVPSALRFSYTCYRCGNVDVLQDNLRFCTAARLNQCKTCARTVYLIK